MLSVLIPIYRQDCSDLIEGLYRQLIAASVSFEILIGDDSCYYDNENDISFQSDMPELRIFKNPKQLGRSKNRNQLAARAQYEYLLFIDGDAEIVHPDFINVYLSHAGNSKVICGGTSYSDEPPADQEQLLRWHYGCKREIRSVTIRSNEPYKQFSSFNFMIHADVFRDIYFSEDFISYGHEDTYFGYQLRLAQVTIEHINNPLYHTGLDSAKDFIEKIKESVIALVNLEKNNTLPDDFFEDIKLLSSYKRIKRYRLNFLFAAFFKMTEAYIVRQLCSAHPQLFLLDMYKLGYLSKIAS
ncbi:MAG: glycosyltransferase [Bacteroidales bacterium]|nr:glycosyltransferase [Bacteroidales bacterium]